MRTERRFVVAASFALALLGASHADAFCRTSSENAPSDHDAVTRGCWTNGLALYQPSRTLRYRLTQESPILPNAVLSEKLEHAFGAWTAANPICSPGIRAQEVTPPTGPLVVGYTVQRENENLVGVRADWPLAGTELGLATVTYNMTTGAIYDVDLEINGTADWSFAETPAEDKVDLQSVLNHEAGHMLGLAHSDVAASAMNGSYLPGSIEPRTLTTDDHTAICTVYPNESQRLAPAGLVTSTPCNVGPDNPEGTCATPSSTEGCAASPANGGQRSGLTGLATLGLGFAAIAAWRRRRAR
jgi:hypothetical protein